MSLAYFVGDGPGLSVSLGLASNSLRLLAIQLAIPSGDCMSSRILSIAWRCALSPFWNISLPCSWLIRAISSKVLAWNSNAHAPPSSLQDIVFMYVSLVLVV